MKKTWKELWYDFGRWFLIVPAVLSICSLWIVILFFIVSLPLNETWAYALIDSFFINGGLVILLFPICMPISNYDKETFLRNKFRYLLFSDSWANFIGFLILAAIVTAIFSEELEKMTETEMMDGIIILAGIAIGAISCMLSKYCKKKIVHIETDKKVVK